MAEVRLPPASLGQGLQVHLRKCRILTLRLK